MNKPEWLKEIEELNKTMLALPKTRRPVPDFHLKNTEALLSALNKACEVIDRTREIILSGAEGAICDTIWESSCGTLVDYLDSYLLDVYNPEQQKLPLEAINQEGK